MQAAKMVLKQKGQGQWDYSSAKTEIVFSCIFARAKVKQTNIY